MNSVTHFELPVNEESRKFYEEAFGWKTQDMDEMEYTMVYTDEVDENNMPKNPGAVNGGMMGVEANGGTNPVLVIDVPSIDEALEKVEAAGLEVVLPKREVGDMGLYARFADHAGVVTGIWETIKKA